ncbi:MAG: hypothetical protein QM504_01585 [Pseudomonadota bacterium]
MIFEIELLKGDNVKSFFITGVEAIVSDFIKIKDSAMFFNEVDSRVLRKYNITESEYRTAAIMLSFLLNINSCDKSILKLELY